jgi:hypothetical protein
MDIVYNIIQVQYNLVNSKFKGPKEKFFFNYELLQIKIKNKTVTLLKKFVLLLSVQ